MRMLVTVNHGLGYFRLHANDAFYPLWREVIATLRFLGYAGILSLEMESEYMEMQEGLEKAAAFIRPLVLELPPGPPWWQIMGMDED